METQEKDFEKSIEKYLVTKGGYHISDGLGYDRVKGYNPKSLIDFIVLTQNKKWMKLISIHGEYTENYFLKKHLALHDTSYPTHQASKALLRTGARMQPSVSIWSLLNDNHYLVQEYPSDFH